MDFRNLFTWNARERTALDELPLLDAMQAYLVGFGIWQSLVYTRCYHAVFVIVWKLYGIGDLGTFGLQ